MRAQSSCPLVRSCIFGDEPDGAQDDLEIKREGPVAEVVEIKLDAAFHLFDGVCFATGTIDLGEAGNAGANFVADHVALDELAVLLVVRYGVRAGADDAHAALEHVDELGEFVQRGSAQDGANTGDAGIVAGGLTDDGAIVGGGHGAEFVDVDFLPIKPVTTLAEDDGARRGDAHGNGARKENGGDQQDDKAGEGEVFDALDDAVGAGKGAFADGYDGDAFEHVHPALDDIGDEDVWHEEDG